MVKVANLEYLVKIYIKNSYNIVKYLFTYAPFKKYDVCYWQYVTLIHFILILQKPNDNIHRITKIIASISIQAKTVRGTIMPSFTFFVVFASFVEVAGTLRFS